MDRAMNEIHFNRPYTTGKELDLMATAMKSGHISGDGVFTRKVCQKISDLHLGALSLLTTSCTHALEMAAMLLDVGPGDEVIMPSFTFVSSANAFVLRGANPVFVDIRPDTLNIDERLIEASITSRTRAICVVHYAGVACDMDAIVAIANRHSIPIVEDNAHGLGGFYNRQPLGTFGSMATLSFHETKNIQCGEGGALILNDPRMIDRAEILREKGTNRSRFFRGEIDKYTWVDMGSSYLPSDILAAFLCAQFDCYEEIQAARLHIWQAYRSELQTWAAAVGFVLPTVPENCDQPAHLFWILAPDLKTRTRFIAHLAQQGVRAVFHYVPLHSSEMGSQFGDCSLPVTDDVSDRIVRLPLFVGLSEAELSKIIDAVRMFA